MQYSTPQLKQAEQPRFSVPGSGVDFLVAGARNEGRDELEMFIKQGFKKSFDATVTTFLPILLGIKSQQLKAVVGVRGASQPLFIEQYLKMPVEQNLQQFGVFTSRHKIAELGNLYSQSRRYTLPLLMTVVMGLYLCDFSHLVFSGTEKVRMLLEVLKLDLTVMADANPNCLQGDVSQWGSYYQNKPKVLLLDINQAVTRALLQPELETLFQVVKDNLPPLLAQMRAV